MSTTMRYNDKGNLGLKACPFCGGLDLRIEQDYFVQGSPKESDPDVTPIYYVECICSARGPIIEQSTYKLDMTDEKAIELSQKKWNEQVLSFE